MPTRRTNCVVTRVNPPGYDPVTRPDRPVKKDIYNNVTRNQQNFGQGDGGRPGPIKYGTDE